MAPKNNSHPGLQQEPERRSRRWQEEAEPRKSKLLLRAGAGLRERPQHPPGLRWKPFPVAYIL